MFKILGSILVVIFISGCFGTKVVKPNEKAFADEDTYILLALRAEQLKDYKSSALLFDILYKKSKKKEYLYRSLEDELKVSDSQKVIQKIDELDIDLFDDVKLVRLKIIALLQLKKIQEAKELAIKLVDKTHEVNDYILVSDIYVEEKKFDTAVKYLESAYSKDYNEKILDRISIILYVNLQRVKDAIAHLETHSRIHGCSKIICTRLLGFYSNENNIDGLLSVSLRLYELEHSEKAANTIAQIYAYKKEYLKLMEFLEKSHSDDEMLLQLYTTHQKYKEAASLAQKLYKETGNIDYLAQSAIFEYESAQDKQSKSMHTSVVKKLTKVLQTQENPLYLNYLGYLMIDHNLDVKKGISYVQKALKSNPNSAFYLDSLAWGYYRLGECQKADTIMQKVVTMEGGDDKEVLSHLKSIQKCVKLQKKESKKKKGKK